MITLQTLNLWGTWENSSILVNITAHIIFVLLLSSDTNDFPSIPLKMEMHCRLFLVICFWLICPIVYIDSLRYSLTMNHNCWLKTVFLNLWEEKIFSFPNMNLTMLMVHLHCCCFDSVNGYAFLKVLLQFACSIRFQYVYKSKLSQLALSNLSKYLQPRWVKQSLNDHI